MTLRGRFGELDGELLGANGVPCVRLIPDFRARDRTRKGFFDSLRARREPPESDARLSEKGSPLPPLGEKA